MVIRQEEQTPIGDYFHDSGLLKVFNNLEGVVDEFEVETDDINSYIDYLIQNLKNLKNHVKKCETEFLKKKQQRNLSDSLNIGLD